MADAADVVRNDDFGDPFAGMVCVADAFGIMNVKLPTKDCDDVVADMGSIGCLFVVDPAALKWQGKSSQSWSDPKSGRCVTHVESFSHLLGS